MADNGTFFSAYPGIVSQGNDNTDHAYQAQLVSHASASVERNQDSQFAAQRSQLLQAELGYAQQGTLEAKYDAEKSARDAERENSRQFAEVKSELAALRAEGQARDIASLRAELAETKAEGRQAKTDSVLAAILAKLPV